jgi:hypothetical protein
LFRLCHIFTDFGLVWSSSHVWLFDGAEGGGWLEEFRRQLPVTSSGLLNADSSAPRASASSFAPPATGNGTSVGDTDLREAKKARVV